MSEQRREELDHFAREHNVSTRWHHLAPVPPDQIGALLRQADFSVIPIQPSCTSYRLCLPNKLFQSLAVGTPVLSTPLPEIVATLDGRPDGIITDGYDAIALARGLKTAHDQTHARPKNARPIDPDFGAAYGRAATDQRWQRLVAAVLSPMNPSGAILPPLPHAAHPSLRTTPRPRSEIIPKGWRRWVGSALIWLTTPWTQR
jgi:glycosyltransferase involved in cell wall biosynthesis